MYIVLVTYGVHGAWRTTQVTPYGDSGGAEAASSSCNGLRSTVTGRNNELQVASGGGGIRWSCPVPGEDGVSFRRVNMNLRVGEDSETVCK